MRYEGFEPKITEESPPQNKKSSKIGTFSPLLSNLAGDESSAGNPLLSEFVLLASKLEQLGFVYHKDCLISTESLVN